MLTPDPQSASSASRAGIVATLRTAQRANPPAQVEVSLQDGSTVRGHVYDVRPKRSVWLLLRDPEATETAAAQTVDFIILLDAIAGVWVLPASNGGPWKDAA